MSSEQNKPLTIGLCSEPGTGKTQFVYQFLSEVLALNAQSGAPEGLDSDAKQYYQKLSAEIEKGVLSPTRDEKSFSVSLSDKAETSQNVKLRQFNFYDESGDSFVNYVEDDEKSDVTFNQLISNSDVLIYTINPVNPEFASETYSQTLQEHIHQLLKTIAKKRGNRYLPVYFLFTHKNELDSLSEDNRAAVQKQMDSLMAFVKQEYQNRYNRTFPKDLASPKTAFGTFDLKRPGSALQVMEETLKLHNCLEKYDKKFRTRSRIVLIPFAIILIGLAIAILSWVLPKLSGREDKSLEALNRRVTHIEEQLLELNQKQEGFNQKIDSINPKINTINHTLETLEDTVKNLPNYNTRIDGIDKTLGTLETKVNNIPDNATRIDGIDKRLGTLEDKVSNIPDNSDRINSIDKTLGTLETKVNNIPDNATRIDGIDKRLGTLEDKVSDIEKKPNAAPPIATTPSGENPKADYGQKIDDINKTLGTLESKVSKISDNATRIDGIDKTLGTLEAKVNDIEKKSNAAPAIVPASSEDKPKEDNYGAQIEDIKNKLETLKNDINNIPNYNQQIQDIRKQIEELKSKIGTGGTQTQSPPKNTATDESNAKVVDGKDQYGVYKKITYKGLTFVFRYCEPCNQGFPMGEKNNIIVKLYPGFWILESEVTNEMWQEIIGNCPSDNKDFGYPVVNVSWDQCNNYCSRLSDIINKACNTNFKFQLPTEAQWEYACRTGKELINEKQPVLKEIENKAWYEDNSGKTIHPVKKKDPNDWGIYDMYGNVWELVRDGWTNKLVSADNPKGDKDSKECVYRGGTCRHSWWYVNWYYRYSINKNTQSPIHGFRICIEGESDSK